MGFFSIIRSLFPASEAALLGRFLLWAGLQRGYTRSGSAPHMPCWLPGVMGNVFIVRDAACPVTPQEATLTSMDLII